MTITLLTACSDRAKLLGESIAHKLIAKQVLPSEAKIKVTGVITPITNQVAICPNKVKATRLAPTAAQRIIAKERCWRQNPSVFAVASKLAGTRTAQIATQLRRDHSNRGVRLSIILTIHRALLMGASLMCKILLLSLESPMLPLTF